MNKFNIYFSFKEKEMVDKSITRLFKTFKSGFSIFSCYGGWYNLETKKNLLEKSMKVEAITDVLEKDVKSLCKDLKEICDQKEIIYYKSKVKLNTI